MNVIVDTSVWSLALRRGAPSESEVVRELRNLIKEGRVRMLGPIRQEILSGVREETQFRRLRKRLEAFPDLPLLADDYVTAAEFFNRCRVKGVQGSNTDFLLCAAAARSQSAIFTADKDFVLFAKHLPIILHQPQSL